MSRNRVVTVLAVLVSVLVVSVLAIPIIQVTVQQLGAGYADVICPVGKAWIKHVFVIEQGKIKLKGLKVKFDSDLGAGTYIRIELRDANDNAIASGEITLDSELPAGTYVQVDISPILGVYEMLQYSRIVIVVSGPEVGL